MIALIFKTQLNRMSCSIFIDIVTLTRAWVNACVAKLQYSDCILMYGYNYYYGHCRNNNIHSVKVECHCIIVCLCIYLFVCLDAELEEFIVAIIKANNRGVSAARNVSSEPNWSFGQSLFFAGTILTTIGKRTIVS